MTYAFTFDASACSGCKACQVACKDKNNLPTDVLWRRVFEVSGGSWTNVAANGVHPGIWQTDVFAYNLSLACNHCIHPKCAGVCPVDAYVQREDGVVYIDESKCMGCGYCAWACPYGVPQYNPELRHMTKCNFCFDEIDQGNPPACVAACPMRVLDFVVLTDDKRPTAKDTSPIQPRCPAGGAGEGHKAGDMIDLPSSSILRPSSAPAHQALWNTPAAEHPFPLPTFSRTQPHLAIKPHAGMVNGLKKAISNVEEVQPRRHQFTKKGKTSWLRNVAVNGFDELPLIAFTLSGQMAAGMAVFSLFGGPLSILMLVIIGGLLGLGGLVSFLHLGTPLNAWRALNNLKKSWLSREILMFGLFGASWLVALMLPGMGKLPLALTGIGLVYSMTQVYRFKAAPTWNTWRTPAAFFLSAGTLGLAGIAFEAGWNWVWLPLWATLVVEAWMALSAQNPPHKMTNRLRGGGIVLTMLGVGILPIIPVSLQSLLNIPIFLLILGLEFWGRWTFYQSRTGF